MWRIPIAADREFFTHISLNPELLDRCEEKVWRTVVQAGMEPQLWSGVGRKLRRLWPKITNLDVALTYSRIACKTLERDVGTSITFNLPEH